MRDSPEDLAHKCFMRKHYQPKLTADINSTTTKANTTITAEFVCFFFLIFIICLAINKWYEYDMKF